MCACKIMPCERRDCETRYLVRTLVSNLRVGANWRSVIGALARAALLHGEATRPTKVLLLLRACACLCPHYSETDHVRWRSPRHYLAASA